MELGTKDMTAAVKRKDRPKVSTIAISLLMIGISISIALLICIPDLWQQIMMIKWDILKGALVGISALPVFLFVTIKGGKEWYKKWWVWVSIAITLIAIVTIVMLKGSPGAGSMGMPSMEAGMPSMDGGMRSGGVMKMN